MITLYLRYTFDPNKISDIRAYVEAELRPIRESGGRILGYFLPTDFSGATNHAYGLIDFDSLAEYEIYLPGGGPGFKGVAGQLNDAVVGGVVAGTYNAVAGVGQETIELGITATGTVATPIAQLGAQTLEDVVGGVGLAKLGFDASTFLYGYYASCHP
jgi:hypothetical protein